MNKAKYPYIISKSIDCLVGIYSPKIEKILINLLAKPQGKNLLTRKAIIKWFGHISLSTRFNPSKSKQSYQLILLKELKQQQLSVRVTAISQLKNYLTPDLTMTLLNHLTHVINIKEERKAVVKLLLGSSPLLEYYSINLFYNLPLAHGRVIFPRFFNVKKNLEKRSIATLERK